MPSFSATSLNNLFLNSVLLSDKIFLLALSVHTTYFKLASTISSVFLVLSGMQNAKPVNMHISVKVY